MTDEEKRIQRDKLRVIESYIRESLEEVQKQHSELCHTFTEDDLIDHGWIKGNFSGAFMAPEYKKGNKILIFKSHEVITYSGKPTRYLEDIQDLIDYENE